MNLKLKNIDENNWEDCIRLQVNENQKEFVAENWYSLLQSTFCEGLTPLAIYEGDVLVGFLMYGTDEETGRMEVCRLMIDTKYQNMGYGKTAMKFC
ncbi:GNAT family N-acetyltransferase [Virgibacillus flavescens]|uniref:GNAT family N-acetyltransferase n=1 Tax=Virgibacillus flavescens TaxID=1611422 RepID=UPI003D33B1C9